MATCVVTDTICGSRSFITFTTPFLAMEPLSFPPRRLLPAGLWSFYPLLVLPCHIYYPRKSKLRPPTRACHNRCPHRSGALLAVCHTLHSTLLLLSVWNRLAIMTAEKSSSTAAANNASTSTSTTHQGQGRGKPAGGSATLSAAQQLQQRKEQQQQLKKERQQKKEQQEQQRKQQEEKEPQKKKELDAIYLVLDCIIDLGLGDRGLP